MLLFLSTPVPNDLFIAVRNLELLLDIHFNLLTFKVVIKIKLKKILLEHIEIGKDSVELFFEQRI